MSESTAETKGQIYCAVCGEPILAGYEYDDPEASECPECRRHLCRGCADWTGTEGGTMCADCADFWEEDE